MSRLRSLASVARAARHQGLTIVPTQLREVLFECPVCRACGLFALACIDLDLGTPVVRCAGCERWGDNPFDVLSVLGHDPDEGEPFELVLRIFDLLWTMHRLEVAA
jgi:hypothetical protein